MGRLGSPRTVCSLGAAKPYTSISRSMVARLSRTSRFDRSSPRKMPMISNLASSLPIPVHSAIRSRPRDRYLSAILWLHWWWRAVWARLGWCGRKWPSRQCGGRHWCSLREQLGTKIDGRAHEALAAHGHAVTPRARDFAHQTMRAQQADPTTDPPARRRPRLRRYQSRHVRDPVAIPKLRARDS
jgi:hypothetical protein